MNFREYLNSSDLGRHYLNEGVKEVKYKDDIFKGCPIKDEFKPNFR